MSTRPKRGKAVFYHRLSICDTAVLRNLREVLNRATTLAQQLGLKFSGTQILGHKLVPGGESKFGDIYLDFASGKSARPRLKALLSRLANDLSVTHVLIPSMDRIARCDGFLAALHFERRLRALGVTVVYLDRGQPPTSLPIQNECGLLETLEYCLGRARETSQAQLRRAVNRGRRPSEVVREAR